MNKFVIASVVALAALTTGCNQAHNNQGVGAVVGGVTGAVVGNQFGSGSGKTAATALGAVIGAMTGSNIGQHMDQPPKVVYQTYNPNLAHGACAHFKNEGARSSCKRGVADRLRHEQRRMEREAYQRGYRR